MKYSKLGSLLLAAVLCCGSLLLPRTAKADSAVSFEFFYDSLDPYGEWVEVPDYGYCWRPSNVDPDWAPYTDGYWANTDAGWTWVSYEDWGGITYHYGRWAQVPDEGWLWVPDYEWAPAWVSWRYSDDYVGWAPLPPRARWRPEVGFSFWVDDYCDIGPRYYNFCEVRNFGSPALRPVIIDRSRNVTIINRTTNITNITVNKTTNIIYNGGPSFAAVSSKSIKPIQTLRLQRQTDVGDWRNNHGPIMARQRGNELLVVAPKVAAEPAARIKPQHVAKVLQTAKVDTGWAGISDPKVREEIHAKFKKESGNVRPEQAPAAGPSERDLKAFQQRVQNSTPNAPIATPPPAVGKKGKHGENLAPFVQPAPTQQPNPAAVQQQPAPNWPDQGKHHKNEGKGKDQPFQNPNPEQAPQVQQPPQNWPEHGKDHKNKGKDHQFQNPNPEQGQPFQQQQMQQQKGFDEQNRMIEQQRKQQANQEKMQRDREERQRAMEAQAQQRQQMQAQKAQEDAIRREREVQAAQQKQQMQMERAQEENMRRQRDAQANEERKMEQARRMQEAQQQRRMEAPPKQMERPPQVQQQGGVPNEGKKHGKDKDKDNDH